jgi:L,D-peptidoglycan transpeptidase YkuD (ErfK/YbiS/YcfS/YnhG family)
LSSEWRRVRSRLPGRPRVLVTLLPCSSAARGWLKLGNLTFPCALGRAGMRVRKREGDGATPAGAWRLRCVLYRPDRVLRPRTVLPIRPLRLEDGWCDTPGDRNYNRLVRHPYPASAERLWRADGLYDVLVVLDYNASPRVRGKGSAIFLHVARSDYAPTEGCIALARGHLVRLLERLGGGAAVRVGMAAWTKAARPMEREPRRKASLSNCKRVRHDRRDRGLRAPDRSRVAVPPAPSRP